MDSSPVTYAFPYKKASQISVEPFLHGDFYFQWLLRPPRTQTAQAKKQGDSFLSSYLAFFQSPVTELLGRNMVLEIQSILAPL